MTVMMSQVVVSCEHAGACVPQRYAALFRRPRAAAALRTHRGVDLGALPLARALARRFAWPLHLCQTTRLLVDVNRSLGHRRLFSTFVAELGSAERDRVLAVYYTPYRDRVTSAIAAAISRGCPVFHLSVHTFTPRLNGETRCAEVGLLYDPGRPREREWCHRWKESLRSKEPRLGTRCNYPYRGTADGLTTSLRRRFPPHHYLGIELEVNQRLVARAGQERAVCIRALGDSLEALLR